MWTHCTPMIAFHDQSTNYRYHVFKGTRLWKGFRPVPWDTLIVSQARPFCNSQILQTEGKFFVHYDEPTVWRQIPIPDHA